MKVREILSSKGAEIVAVRPETPVLTALRRMKAEGIGSVVVSEDGRRLLGLLAERDILHAMAAGRDAVLDRPVSEIMSRAVTTCTPEDSVTAVMQLMTLRRARHVPVLEGGELRGLVSIGDLVKSRLEEAELETRVLRDVYIAKH